MVSHDLLRKLLFLNGDKDMKAPCNVELSHGALYDEMRGLVTRDLIGNSIYKCDSNLRILCQDVVYLLSFRDFEMCEFLAKDSVIICPLTLSTLITCRKISKAFTLHPKVEYVYFQHPFEGLPSIWFATSSPENTLSVIFNFGGSIKILIQFSHGPNLDRAHSRPVTNISLLERLLIGKHKRDFQFYLSDTNQEELKLLLKIDELNLSMFISPMASLSIPELLVISSPCEDSGHLQGSSDPSFKQKVRKSPHSLPSPLSATCNQYALFPTPKASNSVAGRLRNRFGFNLSFPRHGRLFINRWGFPQILGLCGGGESAANGWGGTNSQQGWVGGGTSQANPQGHWGGAAPNRPLGPPGAPSNSAPPQPTNLKSNQTNNSTNGQQSSSPPSSQQSASQANSSSPSSSTSSVPTLQGNSTQPPASGWGGLTKGGTDAQKLQSIKEALLSSEGWGGENVNQETSWDLPTSPEPGKDGAAQPHWKMVASNGCDLWENNLRNGGVPPPKPQQAPWGPNPTTQYWGTWGEEDDGGGAADNSNMWTGSGNNPNMNPNSVNPNSMNPNSMNPNNMNPNNINPNLNPNSLNQPNLMPTNLSNPPNMNNPNGIGNPNTQMNPSNISQLGNSASNMPNMWGQGPPQKKSEWPPGGGGWGDHGPQQRSNMEGVGGHGDWGPPHKPGPHIGAHPGSHLGLPHPPGSHGPSHPGGPHPPVHPHPINHPGHPVPPHPGPHPGGPPPHAGHPGSHPHAPPPSHSQPWNGVKEMGVAKPSGWDEPSPPPPRRDDGTALWGNPQQQQPGVSRWKESQPNMMGRPGMGVAPQNRPIPVPPAPPVQVKDQRMWPQQSGRNANWPETHDSAGSAIWGDESKPTAWGEPPITSPSWASKPKNPTAGGHGNWPEQELEIFGGQTKKDDSEAVLRSNPMTGLDDPLLDLGGRTSSGIGGSSDGWRNPAVLDDHSVGNVFPDMGNHPNLQQRFPNGPQQLPLNSQLASGTGGGNNPQVRLLMHHIQLAVQAGYLNPQILNQPLAPASLMMLNQMLSFISQLHKYYHQHSTIQAQPHLKTSNHYALQLSVQITRTKQQIQNLQNQIASTQAQYMKHQQHPAHHQQSQGNQQSGASQQHQHQQLATALPPHMPINSHMPTGTGNTGASALTGGPSNNLNSNEFFKGGLPDNLYQSPLDQMVVADRQSQVNTGMYQQAQQQPPQHQQQNPSHSQNHNIPQSRLNTWKLPNLDNEDPLAMMNSDFVRAPGKPQGGLPNTQISPNLTILSGANSAWSLSSRPSESGWPDSGNIDGSSPSLDKGSSNAILNSPWTSTPSAQTGSGNYGLDIKPFEPGKPWMVKNIEDDPNITPGSVTRSPLSLGIKASELLTSITKTSTANTMSEMEGHLTSLSLSSNTWTFNPSSGQPNSNVQLSGDHKIGQSKNSTWSDGTQSGSSVLGSELWGAPGSSKSRGPPPGMGTGSSGNKPQSLVSSANGSWGSLGRATSWSGGDQSRPPSSALHPSGTPPWSNSSIPSTWLILKNLTPQIDGSTLKTLCMQHGPLLNFRLALNHGFALVNYGSTEEAAKAQGNLNNCLLSNTTILAELAPEHDVKQLLGQGQTQANSNTPSANWGAPGRGSTPTSSQGSSANKVDSWGNSHFVSSLWGNSPSGLGDDPHRSTPSQSLKPYLPDGLLTSESM